MNVDAAARAAAKAVDRSATRLDAVAGLDDLLRRRRRQPLRRAAAAAAVALLVAAVAIWAGLALRPTPLPTLAPITRFRAGPDPTAVALSPGAVWVLDIDNNTMSRVDPSTARVTATASPRLPDRRDGNLLFAISAQGRLWVVSELLPPKSDDTAISVIDPATGQTVNRFEVGGPISLQGVTDGGFQAIYGDVAVGSGAVWVSLQRQDEVRRFDPATGSLIDRIKLPQPTALAVDDGTVWVGSADGRLRSIDIASGRVTVRATTTTMVPRIQVGQGGVWLMTIDGRVLRVNRRTGRVVAQVPGDFTAVDLAVGPEGIWVYDPQRGAVLRIDPGTNRVARTIPVAAYPLRASGVETTLAHILAVGNGAVWVLDKPTGTMVRVDPYR